MPHGLVNDERILQVLQATSSLDVLDALEDGLSTIVEERGRGFSGGQRQRLSLARAILTNAEVLILVEPTSAVDTHTEGRIAARLRDMRGGHTTLGRHDEPVVAREDERGLLRARGTGRRPRHASTNSSHDRRSIDRSSCERTPSAAPHRQREDRPRLREGPHASASSRPRAHALALRARGRHVAHPGLGHR